MLKFVQKIFGSSNDRYLKKVRPDVERINSFEDSIALLSDAQLRDKTGEFKQKLANGATLEDILHEAFAVVRETGKRQLNMRHYDVQLIGGLVLHDGRIAEMKTGEGKTLVATLPLYLNALAGKGSHLVTVNDYLARRDAEWMGNIYKALGLSVGTIISDMFEGDRRKAYHSDITYGTNNEFGFDYLRDNMKYSLDQMVQGEQFYAIVDEVDSILIDEARTPLIISGAAGLSADMPDIVNRYVPTLKKDEDYLVDEEHRSVSLTDIGVERMQEKMDIENLYEPGNIGVVHALIKALQAHALYKKDDRYIVKDGEVIIVDEFTGRPMPGRRWSDGLHQAVEAKEGLKVQEENQTLATVTFQNFFRMYEKLAGMTGTAETEAEEFHQTYELDTSVIPTNRPIVRIDAEDLVYRSYGEKFNAIVQEILESNANQQPILVGTTSVEKSEAISRVLRKKGIEHSVLNAKLHTREAHIVAQAGRLSAITIATNMAGRGTDILLGGSAEGLSEDEVGAQEIPDTAIGDEREEYWSPEYKAAMTKYTAQCDAEKEEVLAAGGLLIIGTERHESRRIDNQLRGRAGRQGDVGRSRFFLSLEDDLLRLFGADRIAKIMDTLKMEEGVPIEHAMVTKSLENAQRKVEGRNFDIRKNVLEYDDVMDVQRKTIYTLRKNVLKGHDEDGRDIKSMALDLFEEIALTTISNYANRAVRPEDWDLEGLTVGLREVFGLEIEFDDSLGRDEVERIVWTAAEELFGSKVEMCDNVAAAINKENTDIKKAQADAREVIGEDDGNDWMVDEEKLEDIAGSTLFTEQVQNHYLEAIDRYWRQHLQAMEQLRDGIGMRGYAQKDPKKEYKKEGYNFFVDLLMNIKTSVVQFVSQFALQPRTLAPPPAHNVPKQIVLNRKDEEPVEAAEEANTFRRELPKLGRNDPCWCGSGKKYKGCHMRDDQADAS